MDLCDNTYCQLFGCFKITSQSKQDFKQNILNSDHTSTHLSIGILSHFLMCPDFGMGRCHRSDGQLVKLGKLWRWSDGQVGQIGKRGQATFWCSDHIHHVGVSCCLFILTPTYKADFWKLFINELHCLPSVLSHIINFNRFIVVLLNQKCCSGAAKRWKMLFALNTMESMHCFFCKSSLLGQRVGAMVGSISPSISSQ